MQRRDLVIESPFSDGRFERREFYSQLAGKWDEFAEVK
jgi:hypothetical protein